MEHYLKVFKSIAANPLEHPQRVIRTHENSYMLAQDRPRSFLSKGS